MVLQSQAWTAVLITHDMMKRAGARKAGNKEKKRRSVLKRRVRIVTKQTVLEGHIWGNGTKKLKNGINQRSGIMPVAKTWGQEACGGDVKKQGRLRRSTFSWWPRIWRSNTS